MTIAQAPADFVLLVLASTILGVGLLRLGFPGGLMFGPMVASAILHGGDFVHVSMPLWVVNSAMIGLGRSRDHGSSTPVCGCWGVMSEPHWVASL
jgi:uncharacterized membrane protein AbrB (regulator of aidB expression)